MRATILICLFSLGAFAMPINAKLYDKDSQENYAFTGKMEGLLKEIAGIKVGMSRKKVGHLFRLPMFPEEGSVGDRIHQTYIFRNCPYIKVDFEFQQSRENKISSNDLDDLIVRMSKPYLELSKPK